MSRVTLEAHFERLPKVRTAHFGALWSLIGGPEKYPDTDDLYRDEVILEQFPPVDTPPRIDVSIFDRPRASRTRFANDEVRVEVQDDALSASWVGQAGASTYPRYDSVRAHFLDMLSAWGEVTQDLALGNLTFLQTEIVYENRLPLGHGWDTVSDIPGGVLNMGWFPTATQAPVEDFHLYQRQVIAGEDGQPVGRLYASADSAREHEGIKSLDMSLTVRQRLDRDTPKSVMGSLDAGHALIVHTFVTATTARMHELWGRRANDHRRR